MRDHWKTKNFKASYLKTDKTNKINKRDYLDNGKYPIVAQGKELVSGYWNNPEDVFEVKEPVVIFGDHTRNIKYVDFDFVRGADGIKVLKPIKDIYPKFYYYCLKSLNIRDLGYARHFKLLKKKKISYPPLDEQKRIVTILDEAFKAIDQAKANIKQNIENAEDLFQSRLNNILTNSNSEWEERPLKDITSKIGSGATPKGGKKSYKESGISLIRSLNVYDDGFREEDLAFIDDKQASKLDRVKIEKGDVLLNITGASVARCCIVPDKYLPARVNQHVSIVRLKEDTIRPKYLHYCLISRKNKSKLLGISDQGATRKAITKSQIKNFKVRYPKYFEEQDKIIQLLNDFRKFTSELKSIYKKRIQNLNKLNKSILQRAFSGELTKEELVA